MTRERAKELLPVIQAYVDGKKIQFLSHQQLRNKEWVDIWYDCVEPSEPSFLENVEYRIKPEKVGEIED